MRQSPLTGNPLPPPPVDFYVTTSQNLGHYDRTARSDTYARCTQTHVQFLITPYILLIKSCTNGEPC